MFGIKRKFNPEKFYKRAGKFDAFELIKYNEASQYFRDNAVNAVYAKLGLKVVAVSDVHGHTGFHPDSFSEFMSNIDKYDVCILLGDFYDCDIQKILDIIPKERIIALRGNHDSFDIYEKYGIQNIDRKSVTVNGVRIAGIEGSFRYKNRDFPSYTQYESLRTARDMPQGADVLITHDCMFTEAKNDAAHAGLIGITHYVFANGVKWHIHGHLHKSYYKEYHNGTKEKCVYMFEYIEI
ncbi:MAG: hypothetical protein E7588_00495 [Ruminococcaceae bacterium]|nr:hypothetical protein [Oscillospiraceae bacterium]